MKIELKKLQVYERMSEETNCFTAEVYINGTHAGTAINQGQGGPTQIHCEKDRTTLMREAEEWCKAQPPVVCNFDEPGQPGVKATIAMDLELYIDDLVEKFRREKFAAKQAAKMQKAALNHIISHNPSDPTWYREQGSYGNKQGIVPITKVLASEKGLALIKKDLERILPTLEPGEVIFNPELQELLASLQPVKA